MSFQNFILKLNYNLYFVVLWLIVYASSKASCNNDDSQKIVKLVGNIFSLIVIVIVLLLGEHIRCVPAGGGGELRGVPAGNGHPRESGQAFKEVEVSKF